VERGGGTGFVGNAPAVDMGAGFVGFSGVIGQELLAGRTFCGKIGV